jgi:hypothetical protein
MNKKSRSVLSRADGVVIQEPRSVPFLLMAARYRACIRSAHVLLKLVTTPSALLVERDHLLRGADTPPWKGGD